MKLAVIITTYNSPVWLEKVLWGYENQTDNNFDVIIADDGSGEETRNLITTFQQRKKLTVQHVWHKDDGFQKTKILNKAIMQTRCDYLLFTDGDCVPRADTVEVHKQQAEKGRFCSAAYYKLTLPISKLIQEADIQSGDAFDFEWLSGHGQPRSRKSMKLTATGFWQSFYNFITPAKATWNGANSSAFKADIISVNGFDERLQYGGLDRELGERMENKGIKGKQIRYSTICLHLDHKRGYEQPEVWKKNAAIRKQVADKKLTWTEHGIT